MFKKILRSIIFLGMTVSFMVNGQQDTSNVELAEDWYPKSNFVSSPFKSHQTLLTVMGDSSSYKSRNLLRMPFVSIQKTSIAQDWSYIEFSEKIQGTSFTIPFIAPLDWYINKKIQIKTQMDDSLIGGMIVKTHDWVLDGSVREQLTRLKRHLTT